ncbi:hypothetical protein [Butyrivibrio sp. AE3004]|uniref:hypothetical protein n=1 Tax=Butyrivibrio sp. AE3004 TaxID=1506994 RepID=UPI000494D3F0|nr:hypothetical protein [Butyrivibrio sp. AE3004]
MIKEEKIEEIFNNHADLLEAESTEISTAIRLYAYELLPEKTNQIENIDKIKDMVESTSHVLEKMYNGYENLDIGSIREADRDTYNKIVFDLSVFIAVMCIGSRVYDDLDPVFSRDILHAALDAVHFLILRQFKEADDENNEASERVSVLHMSSRDDELDSATTAALMWAFSELLKTDKDVRNAYDHSLMAGMPQKMSRQKRYKMRLSELVKKHSFNVTCKDEEFICLFLSLVVLLDTEETFADEVKRPLYDFLYKDADETDNSLSAVIAILSLQNELDNDEQLSKGASQLIKVVEYNVIGANRNKMTEEDKTEIKEHIKVLEAKLK